MRKKSVGAGSHPGPETAIRATMGGRPYTPPSPFLPSPKGLGLSGTAALKMDE